MKVHQKSTDQLGISLYPNALWNLLVNRAVGFRIDKLASLVMRDYVYLHSILSSLIAFRIVSAVRRFHHHFAPHRQARMRNVYDMIIRKHYFRAVQRTINNGSEI